MEGLSLDQDLAWWQEFLPVVLLQYAEVQISNYKCMRIAEIVISSFRIKSSEFWCQCEMTNGDPLNGVNFLLNRDWCLYDVEHIVQSHCNFLMSINSWLQILSSRTHIQTFNQEEWPHEAHIYILRASRHRPWVFRYSVAFLFMTEISKLTLLKTPWN